MLPLQTSGATHPMPHAPQLFGSVCGSAQAPLHSMRPSPQADTHVAAAHCPLRHVLPHSPQLAGSAPRSTQSPSQSVSLEEHPSSSSPPGFEVLVAHAAAEATPTTSQRAALRASILIPPPLC